MSGELLARCRAALAESNRVAMMATSGPWRHEWSDMCRNTIEADDDEQAVASTWAPSSLPEDDYTRETKNAAHIAANDPATRLALNRALTTVLDGIAEVLIEDHPLPERRGGPCDSCNYLAPCPDRRRATASLAAIAEALGVQP